MSRREGWVFGLTFVGVMALAAVLSLLFQTVAVRLGVQQAWPLLRGRGEEVSMAGWVVSGFAALNPNSGVVIQVDDNKVVAYHLSRPEADARLALVTYPNKDAAIAAWHSILRSIGVMRELGDWEGFSR